MRSIVVSGGAQLATLLVLLQIGPAAAQWRESIFNSEELRLPDSGLQRRIGVAGRLQAHPIDSAIHCLGDARSCPRIIWHETLAGLVAADIVTQVEGVNALVNRAPYVQRAATPTPRPALAELPEFLVHGGDCLDFAVAKYASLRSLGVPAEAMRIMVGEPPGVRLAHAILVVRTDQGHLILDNLHDMVRRTESFAYRPFYSFNESGWALHRVVARETPEPTTSLRMTSPRD